MLADVDFNNIVLPPDEWLEEQDKKTRYTPDIASLEKKLFQRLFLCCNVQKGFEYHSIVEEHAVPYSAAFTQQAFLVYTKKLGSESFPIPLEFLDYSFVPRLPIKGTLMLVEPSAIAKLDTFKLNGEEFLRCRKKIVVPYRHTKNSKLSNEEWIRYCNELKIPDNYDKIVHRMFVDAWMYVGVEQFWKPLLDAGYTTEPTSFYENKNVGKYYSFSTKDLRKG